MPTGMRLRVGIIGGGFGGLSAARELSNTDVDVTLIDRTNHHVFQPLLYQVATAALSPADVAQPLRSILRHSKNIRVVLDEILSIDKATCTLHSARCTYQFDKLIISTGARHSYFSHDDWEQFAPGLKDLRDALHIRKRLLSAFERAEQCTNVEELRKHLTFVIIGGGPTGVELAGAIAEIALHTMLPDFPRIKRSEVRVVLIEAQSTILTAYHSSLSQKAINSLQRIGVEVHTNTLVKNIQSESVDVSDSTIQSSNIIWAAGNTASALIKSIGTQTDKVGRAIVNSDCSIKENPDVYVIGDAANFSYPKTLPGVAQVAMQMGRYVAKNIVRGVVTEPFEYKDLGSMATIGRAHAIAEIGSLKLSGLFAWLAWAGLHILKLISFRNKLKVLVEWMWYYVSFQPGARLLMPKNKTK